MNDATFNSSYFNEALFSDPDTTGVIQITALSVAISDQAVTLCAVSDAAVTACALSDELGA